MNTDINKLLHKIKLVFSVLIFSGIISSCSKEYEETVKRVGLTEFSYIEVNAAFDILLNETDSFYLEIAGDKQVVENVHYEVRGDTLYIENLSKWQWVSPKNNVPTITISSDHFTRLVANETCYTRTLTPITSDVFGLIMKSKANTASLELACRNFYFWNNFPCGGLLRLEGTVQNLTLNNFAIMRIEAKDLVAARATVNNYSKGNCSVYVTNKLEYSIHGLGDIYLYSQPAEIINNGVTSTGEFIIVPD
jgi:hypothetical protein